MRKSAVPSTSPVSSAAEALWLEQAKAVFRDLKSVAHNAADGQVLNQVEAATMLAMRKLTQQTLEVTLQEEVSEREKKKKSVSAHNASKKCGIVDTIQRPS